MSIYLREFNQLSFVVSQQLLAATSIIFKMKDFFRQKAQFTLYLIYFNIWADIIS